MKKLLMIIVLIVMGEKVNSQPPGVTIFDINKTKGGQYNQAVWSYPHMLTVFKNRLYFAATDSLYGYELWRVDSIGQPTRITDLQSGPAHGLWIQGTGLNKDGNMGIAKDGANKEWLFFTAWNTAHGGMVLYKYDGTSAPSVAKVVTPGDSLLTRNFITINNELYFYNERGGTKYYGLYRYNPVTNTIKKLVMPVGGASIIIESYNGKLYFGNSTGSSTVNLYAYDPTPDTMLLVKSYTVSGPTIQEIFVMGGNLYFIVDAKVYKYEPAVTPEPSIVGNICDEGGKEFTFYNLMAEFQGKLVYPCVNNNSMCATCLYDPSNGQTIKTTAGAFPAAFAVHKDKLYFHAGYYKPTHPTDTLACELWEYKGGTDVPHMVADIYPGYGGHPAYSSFPTYITPLGNFIFFKGRYWTDPYTGGHELMKYDVTTVGVSSINFTGSITAYPNPTTGDAVLSIETKERITGMVSVYDITGKEMYHSNNTLFEQGKTLMHLPVSGMAAGTYFYTLKGADGQMLWSGRLVKQ